MRKLGKMAEMAWLIGTVLCAFGVVLCTKSDLGLSFALALVLTGKLTGIGAGTVVIAVDNAPLIRLWSKPVEKFFSFEPMFPKLEKLLK